MISTENTEEKNAILSCYRDLLRVCRPNTSREDKKLIRKAFNLALDAHKGMRRKSGEPYIYHPISVARIAVEDIGLGTISIVCSLLHDVVEDTDFTLEDIRRLFGDKVAVIIDGLTKISGTFESTSSLQAENFRKMLLSLSEDVRVILIKLADRLHNMRTLDSMPTQKQLKISSETLYLYAPLAHRMGLYAIKTEMEDLALKYTEPEIFNSIVRKLKETQAEREKFINEFVAPIDKVLKKQGFNYEILGRTKSIFSIWQKMQKKEIPFEEVYDLFAIRIVIDTDIEQEKADCWRVYSVVTDFYRPNPDRLRDWISTPKANGYESLHTTVMSSKGQWVEVQIRSRRMDEIAEKGYAAHWKYKESTSTASGLDEWLSKIRDLLKNPEGDALAFIDDFKLNLFSDEIFVFTPKGDLKSLPARSTALDFAYSIHTQIGNKCIGAKVNHRLVPLSYVLKSGDQIEIITSNKQKPKEDWLGFVITARAKSKIKNALKEEKKIVAEIGKEILQRKLKQMKMEFNRRNIENLQEYLGYPNSLDVFYDFGKDKLGIKDVRKFVQETERGKWLKYLRHKFVRSKQEKKETSTPNVPELIKNKPNTLIIGDDVENLNYNLANCCNPIPGDDIFGFITINDGIKIHKSNCPNAVQLRSKYAYRVISAKWKEDSPVMFLGGIHIKGIDKVGIVNRITQIISTEENLNIHSINIQTNKETFFGDITVYVNDTKRLNNLINNIRKIDGVSKVYRVSLK